jgi:hypothetical protein
LGNVAGAINATIAGGSGNSASGGGSSVGGGESNDASGFNAVIGGGSDNIAVGGSVVIGGGLTNQADGDFSTVSGGIDNRTPGDGATVGGGEENSASGYMSTVAGGASNSAIGSHSVVGGGMQNSAQGYGATVIGGSSNVAEADMSIAAGYRSKINSLHHGAILLSDSVDFDFASESAREFAVRATGGVRLVTGIDGSGMPTAGAELAAGSGTWGTLSDRNAKEHFQPVDGANILERVAALEITTWNYKAQDSSTRHMGPMAQDFHAAFNLGNTDTRITTVDADGVSLAAIQALNQKLNQALDKKDAQIADLEKRIAKLESLVLQVNESK